MDKWIVWILWILCGVITWWTGGPISGEVCHVILGVLGTMPIHPSIWGDGRVGFFILRRVSRVINDIKFFFSSSVDRLFDGILLVILYWLGLGYLFMWLQVLVPMNPRLYIFKTYVF